MVVPSLNESSGVQAGELRSVVWTMQIVMSALILGVLIFAGITIFILSHPRVQPPPNGPIIISYLGIFAAVVNIVLRFVAPNFVIAGIIRTNTQASNQSKITKLQLYEAYRAGLIIGAALLEGAAFFNIVAVVISRQTWNYAVAGVLLALMAAAFPTLERVDSWAEEKLRQAP